jgi:HK97 family phage prohead protease
MEYRMLASSEVRVSDPVKREVTVIPVTYDRLDTYKTVWTKGVFADSVATRAPRMCWAHDWRDPIGKLTDWQDGDTHPTAVFRLDEFDDVPRARQAFAQIRSGTIDNFSVGFERIEDRAEEDSEKRWGVPDAVRILRATLDEVSPVLVGSVPGTATIGTRSGDGVTIARTEFLGLVRNLRDGEMTLDEALKVLHEVAGEEHRLGMHKHAKQDGSGHVAHSHVNGMTTHAHSGLMPRAGLRSDDRAQWTAAARKEAVDKGWAMADGTFPIKDSSDVEDAVHLWQSGHHQTPAAKAHIIKRARAIGAMAALPDDWKPGRSVELEQDIGAALALVEEAI